MPRQNFLMDENRTLIGTRAELSKMISVFYLVQWPSGQLCAKPWVKCSE